MKNVVVSIKMDPKIKEELQDFAESVGLSMSAILNNQARKVLAERTVEFTEALVPNAAFAKQLDGVESDVRAGRNLTGPMPAKQALAYLKSLPHAD